MRYDKVVPKKNPFTETIIFLKLLIFFSKMHYGFQFSNYLFHFVHFITLNDISKKLAHLFSNPPDNCLKEINKNWYETKFLLKNQIYGCYC